VRVFTRNTFERKRAACARRQGGISVKSGFSLPSDHEKEKRGGGPSDIGRAMGGSTDGGK